MKFRDLRLLFLCICILLLSCEEQPINQTIGYVESNLLYISCPVGGYLDMLAVDYGQSVQKGQLILKLNPQPEQEQVAVAKAKWRNTQDNLSLLKENKQSVSKHKINAMEEEVAAALANLKAARWTLDIKNITAPTSGIITDIFYQQGEYIPPARPLMSLFVPSKMRIVFFIAEPDLNKVNTNKQIHMLFNNQRYPTRIIYIGKQAEFTPESMFNERNRHKLVYKIKAEVPASLQPLLKAGQPIDVNYE